jgi:carbon monoxide dehydrogenase subunit G
VEQLPLGWLVDADSGYNDAVTWFSARNASLSTVPVDADTLWELITDPATLAELTPLVRSIEASGSNWRWTLNGIEGLGLKVEAVFTERMEFIDRRQIVFSHEPAPGHRERAAVEGVYDFTPVGDKATELRVDLTLLVDLPLPRLSKPAVEKIMESSMRLTGHRFATNLYERLGLDPSTVSITELAK